MAKKSLPQVTTTKQLVNAFERAFTTHKDKPIDASQAFKAYLELAAANDWSAASLAIGDAIVALPNSDRACIIDLMIFLIERQGQEIIR